VGVRAQILGVFSHAQTPKTVEHRAFSLPYYSSALSMPVTTEAAENGSKMTELRMNVENSKLWMILK